MFGLKELKQTIHMTEDQVGCPVLGCNSMVSRQRHSFKTECSYKCFNHKIYISPSTFEYENANDNILWQDTNDLKALAEIKADKRPNG